MRVVGSAVSATGAAITTTSRKGRGMDLPKIIGILGTAEDRCGLVSLVTSQGNGRLVLRVQDPNGTVQKPYSHEELAEAMAVEGGGLPINPAIPFCVPSVRGDGSAVNFSEQVRHGGFLFRRHCVSPSASFRPVSSGWTIWKR